MSDKTLTVALMDPPYESANSTTAFRIIAAALNKGITVNVFGRGDIATVLERHDQIWHW